MRRREFLCAFGCAAAWSRSAAGQQKETIRRIGVLSGLELNDPQSRARIDAFLHRLQRLGWTEGQNIHFDFRSGGENATSRRKNAAELVALTPEVILAIGSVSVDDLIQATRTIPIVFTAVADPVGAGYVESLAQPGGNVTGFMLFEYNLSGKWLELLKEITPGLRRVGVLREPALPTGIGQLAVIQAVAPSLGVDVHPIRLGDPAEMERAIATLAPAPAGGLITTAGPSSIAHRDLIIALAAQYKIPAVYYERVWVVDGGLMSYGPNLVDQNRDAATYVDRILRGAKPAELPVQAPTKYQLIINLKAAGKIGLDMPHSLLVRADEVIE